MSQTQLTNYSQSAPDSYTSDNGDKKILKSIYGDIPLDIENGSYLSIFRESKRDIHNIALYPCKFIPELPAWAIKKYSKTGDVVLDPFVGAGTTMVECLRLGRHSLGIDYNPYARLVSNVKTKNLQTSKLKELFKKIQSSVIVRDDDVRRPSFKGVEFWFNKDVIDALSQIKNNIQKIENDEYRDFFLVSFSMAVRKSSYIAPGQILTARRKDWRTIKQLSYQDTIDLFNKFTQEYIDLHDEFHNIKKSDVSAKIIGEDARHITLPSETAQVDLIVSSPPYINAMDYVWANRLRLHWLDLVEDDKERLDLYNLEIGTERIPKKEYDIIGETGLAELDKVIREIYHSHNSVTQSRLRSRVVYRYFQEMKRYLEQAYNVLKEGGRYCIVIGDNNIRKVRVSTSEFIKKLAKDVGFEFETQFQIILKNRSLNVERNLDFADDIKFDRMVVLKKE